MNKTAYLWVVVSFLSLGLIASSSYAAGTTARSRFMMFNSDDLIGAPVKDSHGELMGIVNDVMVDSGGRSFAVIEHGDYDLAGEGGINTPVPFQELRISRTKAGQYSALLKTDMEHLDLAPYLNPAKKASRRDEAAIYEYYGIEPRWNHSGAGARTRFTEESSRDLVGAAVEDSCGKVVGIVDEVMADSDGRALAVINHGDYDFYGDEGINTPVPFQELRVTQSKAGQDVVFLKTDVEHLDFAPYLNPIQANDRGFEARIYEYYGLRP